MADAPGPSSQVFISYHSGDSDWVRRLAAALRERSIRVWLDQDEIRPGDAFPQVLERALETVACVLFVVSTGAMRSRWVREEYHRALVRANSTSGDLRLIAVLIDDAERPPGFMGSRTWVDFRDPGMFARAADLLAAAIAGRPSSNGDHEQVIGVDRGDEGVPVDYLRMLETLIGRTHAAIQRFVYIRVGGACAGGILTAMGVAGGAAVPPGLSVVLPLSGALFTGLVASAATLRELARRRRDLRGLEMLRDGLQTCGSRTLPACRRLREVFWTTIEREVDENLPGARRPVTR
jgi:hypothetical protein